MNYNRIEEGVEEELAKLKASLQKRLLTKKDRAKLARKKEVKDG
jgi:hypothetical protein